jgi:hypothetical protein
MAGETIAAGCRRLDCPRVGLFRRSRQHVDPAPDPPRQLDGHLVILEARAESYSQPGRLVSGNGMLTLTEAELVFVQRVPHREIRIPRASITGLATPRPFNSRLVPALLRVSWTTESGEPDYVALKVKDLDGWLAALR